MFKALLAILLVTTASTCPAAQILFSAEQLGGQSWRYDYTITNDTLGEGLSEFTIFFDRNLYANLTLASSPTNWDSLLIQPDLWLPDDGFLDSLTLAEPLALRESVTGLSVIFDWLGTVTPGAQRFDIVDPLTFDNLESGLTVLAQTPPPTSVPEPSTLALMSLGSLLALALRRRRNA